MPISVPNLRRSLLVRTDFTDNAAWLAVSAAATAESEEGFRADVEPVDDRQNDEAAWESLREAVAANTNRASVLFVVDSVTLSSSENPILVVDLTQFRIHGTHLKPFRCVPSELWGIDNNLNIANMDWAEFADDADEDGVFCGF